jgi:hypothetical protein
MANQEQLDILKQGVEAWNQWREEHPDIRPDLSGSDLNNAHLRGVDLQDADLSHADLHGANFSDADLSDADLNFADLHDADLHGANFSDVDLSGANFSGADLYDVNFRGANFRGVIMGWASFGDVDLSVVKNLEKSIHQGPSTIGIDTIYRSGGNIPETFLREAGVPDSFLEYMRSLVGKPIDYYSCFISYSSKDNAFARRLYADLQSNHVRCWFAPEDLKWGERIRAGIDEAIRVHDKLLLILSTSSVASGWVEREVRAAMDREQKENRTVLFPVRVDRAVFESPFDWATEIRRERNIGDFTRWKDHDQYQKAFTRLLRDLQATEQLP